MKSAALDVLHHTVEELKNELAGFKKTMAGVCRKYDENFRRHGVSARHLHEGWIAHEAAIEKINERCTCGEDSNDEFETVETVSSPSPIGTPVLPEPVPLQMIPTFQVRWVTRRDLCNLLTCLLQMRLLPEEVPLPSSLEASAVRGRQRAVPSDPLVRRCMAEKLSARQKSLPYGGVAKRRRRDRTASATPKLPSGDKCDSASRASLYCGSYGETSDSSSSCSGRVFSKSCGDRLPCSCERFPWDHRRTLECRLLAAGLSDWNKSPGVVRGWRQDLV